MADPQLPKTRPRTFMGQPVGGPGLSDRGPRPRSFFEAAAAEWEFTMEEIVKSRWRRIGEPAGEALRQEEYERIVGERDIPFEPGITANEAERRVAFFDYDQVTSKYQGRPIAQLVGGAIPSMLDPVSIATLPIGAARFAKGAAAATWGAFFKQTAIGGAQAGLASLPLEIAAQRGETAELRPFELGGSVIGPIIAPIGLGAFGRGARSVMRRIKNGPTASQATRNYGTTNDLDPAEAEAAIRDAKDAGLQPPPNFQRTRNRASPTQRLADEFNDYEGGHRQWVRDLAAGRQTALDKARAVGIDPDDRVIERMLDRLGRASDQRSSTPTDYNLRLLDTFQRFRAGDDVDDADLRLLADNGLALPRVRVVDGQPQPRTTAEGTPDVATTAAGRRLAEALDNPKSVSNAKLLRRVNRDGAAAVRNELDAKGEPVPARGRVIDDEFDDVDLLRALDGVRRTNGDDPVDMPPPRRAERVDTDEEADLRALDEAEAEDVAWGREQGADVEGVTAAIKAAMRKAVTCGQ